MTSPEPPIQVLPRDLAPYRKGNTGIDYVHRFDSGREGPHVLVNALTHGNEFCGMVAACHLLDAGVRPKVGILTVSFANVDAYETFDPAQPSRSRQVVHNLNRIWSALELEGALDSPELRRARQLRPAVAAADHILDIHSTSQDVPPFWVYPAFERNSAVALAIGRPEVHLVMPGGLGSGTPLIQHGRHGEAQGQGCAVVVECGQHFLRTSSDLATHVALDFLAHFGLVDPDPARPPPPAQRRFDLLQTHVIKTTQFRFARPVVGFEVFRKGELVYTDGPEEVRAPVDDCTIFMPSRETIVGKEAVYLTRRIA
ncbi:MAG: succinylglutamate desuccinylase/aspartoacylase family protein [Pseudomonadota bacterium]|nr:succinylglutamate desuccinylase/aspartoacylase family protein [Pseudomonadota bacterium]